jgi:hypothetical protein
MTQKNIVIGVGSLVLLGAMVIAGYFFNSDLLMNKNTENIDPTPKNMTLSGTYACLPHINSDGPHTMECAFGIRSVDGKYYAVNFGAGSDSMSQFQSGSYVTLEGFFVPKQALSTDTWNKYNMEGIFTVTSKPTTSNSNVGAKINIDAVCEGALAYMSFPDGKSADIFVQDCKDGKHPEVIEKYKLDMGLGDGANI